MIGCFMCCELGPKDRPPSAKDSGGVDRTGAAVDKVFRNGSQVDVTDKTKDADFGLRLNSTYASGDQP